MNLSVNHGKPVDISSPGGRLRMRISFFFSQREHRRNRWSDPPSCCAHSAQRLRRVDVLAWATLVSKFQPILDDFDHWIMVLIMFVDVCWCLLMLVDVDVYLSLSLSMLYDVLWLWVLSYQMTTISSGYVWMILFVRRISERRRKIFAGRNRMIGWMLFAPLRGKPWQCLFQFKIFTGLGGQHLNGGSSADSQRRVINLTDATWYNTDTTTGLPLSTQLEKSKLGFCWGTSCTTSSFSCSWTEQVE